MSKAHKLDTTMGNNLARLWRNIVHERGCGWFWAWGSYGIDYDDEGKYWLWGLGPITLCCYNGMFAREWSIQLNID